MAQLLRPQFVEFIPERLEEGVLYVSRRFSTCSHLCCCGCGLEVVTPLNQAKWRLSESNGEVSLYPSIGNWGFPCKSHYWIEDNNVRWAGPLSAARIAEVQAQDRRDAELAGISRHRLTAAIWRYLQKWRDWLGSITRIWKD